MSSGFWSPRRSSQSSSSSCSAAMLMKNHHDSAVLSCSSEGSSVASPTPCSVEEGDYEGEEYGGGDHHHEDVEALQHHKPSQRSANASTQQQQQQQQQPSTTRKRTDDNVATSTTTYDNDTDDPFVYRSIEPSDRDPVKRLHEDWFPVTYQDEFYDDLSRGHLAGAPLFTRLAIVRNNQKTQQSTPPSQTRKPPKPPHTQPSIVQTWLNKLRHRQHTQQQQQQQQPNGEENSNPPEPGRLFADTFELDEELGLDDNHIDDDIEPYVDPIEFNTHASDDEEDEDYGRREPLCCFPAIHEDHRHSNNNSNHSYGNETNQCRVVDDNNCNNPTTNKNDEEEVIAGCVVGSFMHVTRLPKPLRNLLVSDPVRHYKLFYIMTLGTVSEFRGAGLGTRLVQQCMDEVQNDATCGALYLHVITHNTAAIRLYERLGFYRVQEIADYYDIQGQKYPCYLYAKYYHGNAGHLDVYKWIANCVWSFVKHVWHLSHLSSSSMATTGLLLGLRDFDDDEEESDEAEEENGENDEEDVGL